MNPSTILNYNKICELIKDIEDSGRFKSIWDKVNFTIHDKNLSNNEHVNHVYEKGILEIQIQCHNVNGLFARNSLIGSIKDVLTDFQYKVGNIKSNDCDCGANHTSNPKYHYDWCKVKSRSKI